MNINDSELSTLKTLREASGKTQKEVSNDLGVAVSTIGYWESGTKKPSYDKFIALAGSLRVPLKLLARAMGQSVALIPDDFPDAQSVIDAARDRNKSIRQIFVDAGYDVTGIPED